MCSCGWERECVSAWAAESVSRLHQQLGDVGVEHVTRIEAPEGPTNGEQLHAVPAGCHASHPAASGPFKSACLFCPSPRGDSVHSGGAWWLAQFAPAVP